MTEKDTFVNVYYTVGGREQRIANVNVAALRDGIRSLAQDQQKSEYLTEVLLPDLERSPTEDDIIDALITKPAHLVLKEDITCKTQFFASWWTSKTPAAGVLCLLNSAIEAKMKAVREEEDDKLRRTFDAPKATEAITSHISNEQVQAWLRNWEANHR